MRFPLTSKLRVQLHSSTKACVLFFPLDLQRPYDAVRIFGVWAVVVVMPEATTILARPFRDIPSDARLVSGRIMVRIPSTCVTELLGLTLGWWYT